MIKENVHISTVFFDTDQLPDRMQVGGKAMSLIQLTRSGLPVPEGFVLPVSFFQPWLDQVQQSPDWDTVLRSPAAERRQRTSQIKASASQLPLEINQRAVLSKAMARLIEGPGPQLFAVRSSSPEEDLEEFSFAGGYVTVLGVTPEKVEEAIRLSFISCLDERVLAYKQEHGMDIIVPRIAVIVQRQIAAEKAGVAFSINPLNNNYDEAVINANFGLGETVVSGQVSPDTYRIDKTNRAILERKVGTKAISIWLDQVGGTFEKPSPKKDQQCMLDAEMLSLTDLLNSVENLYQKPVDIEWAIAQDRLCLLQARPITAYFPIPDALRTKPGERRNLYIDFSLTKWGMNGLMSVLGLSFLERTSDAMLRDTFGNISKEAIHCLRIPLDGRVYINLSNTLKLQGKKAWVASMRTQDVLVAEIVRLLDEQPYLPQKLPRELKGFIFRTIRTNLRKAWSVLSALRDPQEFERRVLAEHEQLLADFYHLAQFSEEETISDFADRLNQRLMRYMAFFMPAFYAAMIALNRMRNALKDQPQAIRDQANYLERGLPHNITVQMGLEMYHLSHFPEISNTPSGAEFHARLKTGALSPEFMAAWEQFIHNFGFRSPMEMDSAVARFAEQPEQLFELLHSMSRNQDTENNSRAVYERAIAEREQTYQTMAALIEQKSRRKSRQFARNYKTFTALGGFREAAKYYFVLMTGAFRQRSLAAGQSLVNAGRLEQPDDVFGLTIEELDKALVVPSFELRSRIAQNNRYWKQYSHVREFPTVFDSRGRILRLPRKPAREGEIQGEPISAGTVTGRVKILRQPNEKPLLPGEILVTRATDPGWTPLFINAGGIILEVGGLLQHGALVAREYGKPCVAGIENAVEVFKEGQIVELNGSNGVVRVISEPGLS